MHVYVTDRRKPHRREWFSAERAHQRQIARELTRAANSGSLDEAEELIDNRQTHVGGEYHGGWWD